MPDTPIVPPPGNDNSQTKSVDSGPSGYKLHQRSRLSKILTPLALFILGVFLGLVAFFVVYPAPETGIPAPNYSSLSINTNAAIYSVVYSVVQISPGTAELQVSMREQFGIAGRSSTALATPTVQVILPLGFTFQNCHFPYCANRPTLYGSIWYKPLTFESGTATAVFPVNSSRFGVNFNGVNAFAAIPEVSYQYRFGLTTPTLLAEYEIPSASSYDWSSFPTAMVSKSAAVWQESIAKGDTAGRVASGVNHARETRDANLTFLAGALLGLGGGAILSAVQEALHPD
jgi:hypothetical protein